MGLKLFIQRDSSGQRIARKPEWNKPNDKAVARLAARTKAFEALSDDVKRAKHFTKAPGSLKLG